MTLKECEEKVKQAQDNVFAKLYGGRAVNSFEPFSAPREDTKGAFTCSYDIRYGEKYPNSYLDIIYDKNAKNKPVIICFHGGGFVWGDKSSGDPMAAAGHKSLLLTMAESGFVVVSPNYCLAPEYRYPTQIKQAIEAIEFISDNAEKYGIDKNKMIVMGGSAGAVFTSIFGLVLTNPDYADRIGIHTRIKPEQIKALGIDCAPFLMESMNPLVFCLFQNWIGKEDVLKTEECKQIKVIDFITKDYPETFLTAGNTNCFPDDGKALDDTLKKCGVEHEFYFVPKEVCELGHGYMDLMDANKYARECFDHMVAFFKNSLRG